MFDKSQLQKTERNTLRFIIYSLFSLFTAVYFDFFETEYIIQEVLNKIKDKLITHNRFEFGKQCDILLAYLRGQRACLSGMSGMLA